MFTDTHSRNNLWLLTWGGVHLPGLIDLIFHGDLGMCLCSNSPHFCNTAAQPAGISLDFLPPECSTQKLSRMKKWSGKPSQHMWRCTDVPPTFAACCCLSCCSWVVKGVDASFVLLSVCSAVCRQTIWVPEMHIGRKEGLGTFHVL